MMHPDFADVAMHPETPLQPVERRDGGQRTGCQPPLHGGMASSYEIIIKALAVAREDAAVYGRELGLRPGPRVGEITKAVYELQLDGTVSDLAQAIEAARRLV